MLRVAVGVWIGQAAAVLRGCWGAVTRRAPQTGVSRTSREHHAQRVAQAVGNAQAVGGSDASRWAAQKRLRAANAARATAAEGHEAAARPIAMGREVFPPQPALQRVLPHTWRQAERC